MAVNRSSLPKRLTRTGFLNSLMVAEGTQEVEFSRNHKITLLRVMKNWKSSEPVSWTKFDVANLSHSAELSSLHGRAIKIVDEIYRPTAYGIALMSALLVPGIKPFSLNCANAYEWLRRIYLKNPGAPSVAVAELSSHLGTDAALTSMVVAILEDMSACNVSETSDQAKVSINSSIKDKADIWAVFENLIVIYSSYNSSRNGYGLFADSIPAQIVDNTHRTIAMCPAALIDWQKTNDRLLADPAGAMTSARSMLESAVKWIHHQHQADPPSNTASSGRRLKDCLDMLSGTDNDFDKPGIRRMISGMETAMNGLDEARNGMGDGHGASPIGPKANPRIARVVVGLATAITVFLLATYESRLRP